MTYNFIKINKVQIGMPILRSVRSTESKCTKNDCRKKIFGRQTQTIVTLLLTNTPINLTISIIIIPFLVKTNF